MGLSKSEIESLFSKYYIIDPPKHILVLDKPAVGISGDKLTVYRGLQPKDNGEIIIITSVGDDETVIHETLHAQYFAREPLANIGGKLLVIKHRIQERINGLKFGTRQVNYNVCPGCKLCNDLSQVYLATPPNGKPIHYQLVN